MVEDRIQDVKVENRRAKITQTIESLVNSREQMLVSFALLAGMPASETDSDPVAPQPKMLQSFLQQLVDYLALGHFEIYQRIKEGNERRAKILEAATKYFPTLLETTDYLIEFNDKYDAFEVDHTDKEELDMLRNDLRQVGQALSKRADVEDLFLESLG